MFSTCASLIKSRNRNFSNREKRRQFIVAKRNLNHETHASRAGVGKDGMTPIARVKMECKIARNWMPRLYAATGCRASELGIPEWREMAELLQKQGERVLKLSGFGEYACGSTRPMRAARFVLRIKRFSLGYPMR
jgi:hypothetical protein